MNNKKNFTVTMLGNFSIKYNGKDLFSNIGKKKQVLNLLQYLLIKRKVVISNEKLIDLLWPYQEIINPAGALKNLVYRISVILREQTKDNDIKLIVSKHGNYVINDAYNYDIDTELFECLAQKALKEDYTNEEKISFLNTAIAVYKGDFLSTFSGEEWIIPIAASFKSLFFECVGLLNELYFKEKNYAEAEKVCSKAIEVDPFYENASFAKITSLLKQNKPQAALLHYEYITTLYYKELGVVPSDRLKKLYLEILKEIKNAEADLYTIKSTITRIKNVKGAYFCDYTIFEQIYNFYERIVERTANSNYLSVLSLKGPSGGVLSPEKREEVMEVLKTAIRNSTRRSDVFARYSGSQFILLLLNTTYEDTMIIDKRIKDGFNSIKKGSPVNLNTEYLLVETSAIS